MRVLFADKLPDQARVRLAAAGFEVSAEPTLSGDELTGRLAELDPQVLVVRSTRLGPEQFAAASSLSLIVRAGAGVNTIDLDGASARGIYVSNCPGKNAVAVAELTFGLLLAMDRHIPAATADLKAGRWNKATYSKARGLKGRTLGIIGMGQIGEAVTRRARSFGLEVLAWSRSLTDERAGVLGCKRYDSPEDVARRSDILSVHLALTPATRGLIGESIFAEMKHDAMFVNTSRAEVVDEDALLAALDAKDLRAGLDVFSDEPSAKRGEFDHPLARHPRVVGTHHIGASTEQAQEAVADEACRVVLAFRSTGRAPNCVNLTEETAATWCLVVRHLDRVGVLANVLDALRRAEINVQEMDNTIFDGGEAASARIQLSDPPSEDTLDGLGQIEHVLHIDLVPLDRKVTE